MVAARHQQEARPDGASRYRGTARAAILGAFLLGGMTFWSAGIWACLGGAVLFVALCAGHDRSEVVDAR